MDSRDGIQANRQIIEGILNSGQIDYLNFRAALACLDSLDGRNNPDRFNEKYARPYFKVRRLRKLYGQTFSVISRTTTPQSMTGNWPNGLPPKTRNCNEKQSGRAERI